MKINGKNAVIATMAIAMAAGIAGSISGTVAWFQYNTRVTSEFSGTTAKCTEFLQVRTVKQTIDVKGWITGDVPTAGYTKGQQYIKESDHKIYTCTAVENDVSQFDTGVVVADNVVYKDSSAALHVWNGSAWEASPTIYGEWGTAVTNDDIVAASAGAASNGLKPVTLPMTGEGDPDAALGTLYGQPVCGYEQYALGTYKWQDAEPTDYYGFGLQFRVLDIDGGEKDGTPALYAQDLYLMDVTVSQIAVDGKKDVSSALRVHVDGGDGKRALLAPGAGTSEYVSTTTHGALDLGGATGSDTLRDVPNAYSFNTAATALDYGKDKPAQKAYDMNKKMGAAASNGLYPVNDLKGHLSGGKALGKTTASAGSEAVADDAHLTINFKIFLEGWQSLGDPASTLWSSASYIGAKFNIGMSFGVTTLD